jgi:hypothetical protein
MGLVTVWRQVTWSPSAVSTQAMSVSRTSSLLLSAVPVIAPSASAKTYTEEHLHGVGDPGPILAVEDVQPQIQTGRHSPAADEVTVVDDPGGNGAHAGRFDHIHAQDVRDRVTPVDEASHRERESTAADGRHCDRRIPQCLLDQRRGLGVAEAGQQHRDCRDSLVGIPGDRAVDTRHHDIAGPRRIEAGGRVQHKATGTADHWPWSLSGDELDRQLAAHRVAAGGQYLERPDHVQRVEPVVQNDLNMHQRAPAASIGLDMSIVDGRVRLLQWLNCQHSTEFCQGS